MEERVGVTRERELLVRERIVELLREREEEERMGETLDRLEELRMEELREREEEDRLGVARDRLEELLTEELRDREGEDRETDRDLEDPLERTDEDRLRDR